MCGALIVKKGSVNYTSATIKFKEKDEFQDINGVIWIYIIIFI
jgi:hypothetical protein